MFSIRSTASLRSQQLQPAVRLANPHPGVSQPWGSPRQPPPTATCTLGRVTQQALCPVPSRTGSRQDIDHALRDARLQGQLRKLQGRERGDLRVRDRRSGPEGWAEGASHQAAPLSDFRRSPTPGLGPAPPPASSCMCEALGCQGHTQRPRAASPRPSGPLALLCRCLCPLASESSSVPSLTPPTLCDAAVDNLPPRPPVWGKPGAGVCAPPPNWVSG